MDIAKIRKKATAGEKADEKQSPPPATPEKEAPSAQPSEGVYETRGELQEARQESVELREEEGVPTSVPPPPGSDRVDEKAGEAVPAEEARGEEALELLTFSLSKEEFAFRVSEVEEIIRHQRITHVPTLPVYVRGITSLRGKIIPVMDLKTRLSLEDAQLNEAGAEAGEGGAVSQEKILILSGPKGLIGAAIDRVLGVVRLPGGSILEPPAHLSEKERIFLEGVVILDKRFISVIRAVDALNVEVG